MREEELLAAGFKEGRVGPLDRCDRQWHKMVKDSAGRMFQINVRFWQHSRYSRPSEDVVYPDGWDATAQFTQGERRESNERTFDILLHARDMSAGEIENWFTTVWHALRCSHYERYDEA